MFTIHRQVSLSDINENGSLSTSSLIKFMQDCSEFQIDSNREISQYLSKHEIGIFLASRQLDIIRSPQYGEKVTISTWIFEDHNIFGNRNSILLDEQGNVCACCYALGAFVNLKSGHPLHLDFNLFPSFQFDPKLNIEYTPRKIELPDNMIHRVCQTRPVEKYQLDFYRHVNNAIYVQLACEFLPDDFQYNRVRIEYLHQARKGNSLTSVLYTAPDSSFHTVVFRDSQTEFARVEFTKVNLAKIELPEAYSQLK